MNRGTEAHSNGNVLHSNSVLQPLFLAPLWMTIAPAWWSSTPQTSPKPPWPHHFIQKKRAWRCSLQLCMCALGFVGLAAGKELGWQTGSTLVGAVARVSGQARLGSSWRCFLVRLLIRMGTELGKCSYSTLGASLPGWYLYFRVDHVLTHWGRLC